MVQRQLNRQRTMEVEAPVEMEAAMLMQQLDREIRVLTAISGVKGIYKYPKEGYDPTDFNVNRIVVKVKDGDNRMRTVTSPCSAALPHWFHAAREAKSKVAEIVGKSAVDAAEEQVQLGTQPQPAAPAEITDAELEWLSNWYDEQPEPDHITLEQANAALATHRASSGGTSATQVLFEAEWLRAKLRAATGRRDRAAAEMARLEAMLAERQPEKRQRAERSGEERPPNWEKYKNYTHAKYQVLETKERA